jgi:ribosomal protein S14
MGDILGPIIVAIIVLGVVLLICRELVCWYWKINSIVSLLEEQNRLLADLKGNVPRHSQDSKGNKSCKRCGKTFESGYNACPHCGSPDFD